METPDDYGKVILQQLITFVMDGKSTKKCFNDNLWISNPMFVVRYQENDFTFRLDGYDEWEIMIVHDIVVRGDYHGGDIFEVYHNALMNSQSPNSELEFRRIQPYMRKTLEIVLTTR